MKFLVDNAMSPVFAECLRNSGHDAVHVRDLGMQHAQDLLILLKAAEESRIVVSADSDFGTLLADRESSEPSVILFRHDCERRPEKQASVLVQNLSSIESALAAGAVVVFEKTRVRVRPLPIHRR